MYIFELMKMAIKYYYLLFVILIITIGVYSSVPKLDFVNWDDDENIVLNTHIQQVSYENIKYNFENERYKSLALYSFMFDYALWKLNPAPYHIHNLVLHLINIILIFLLVSLLTKQNYFIALSSAALFALHPVSVEAVAWITGRKDLLFMLFSLLSILAYYKYFRSNYNIWWLLLVSVLVFFASMAKIQAFVLPVVFLAFDYFFKRKIRMKMILEKILLVFLVAKILDYSMLLAAVVFLFLIMLFLVKFKGKKISIPKVYGLLLYYVAVCLAIDYHFSPFDFFWLLALFLLIKKGWIKHFFIDKAIKNTKVYWYISFLVTVIIIGVVVLLKTDNWSLLIFYFWPESGADVFSLSDRLLLAGNAFIFYIKRLFLLQAFNPMPAYPEPGLIWSFGNPFFVNFLLAIIIISLMGFVIIKYFKKNRLVVLGILIFLVNISIVMHIIPIEGRVVAADRYAYVSFWGLFIVIAYFIDKLLLKYNYFKIGTVSLICVSLAISSYSNVGYWKNSYTLWQKAVTEDQNNSYALNSLGIAYFEIKENPDSALIMINRALEIQDNVPEYHVDKGRVLFKIDSLNSALIYFNNAILLDSTNDMAYNNRGTLLIEQLEYETAISDFETAIKLNDNLELYKENYFKAKRLHSLDSVLLADFNSPEFSNEEKVEYIKLASDRLIAQGKEQSALEYLLIGLKIKDKDIPMLQNVAAIYSRLRQYEISIEYYKQLINLNPDKAEYYYFLANNFYNNGNRLSACENWSIAKLYGHNQAEINFDTFCKKD
jgi:tetratricopeptide (TPR) repeat protein